MVFSIYVQIMQSQSLERCGRRGKIAGDSFDEAHLIAAKINQASHRRKAVELVD